MRIWLPRKFLGIPTFRLDVGIPTLFLVEITGGVLEMQAGGNEVKAEIKKTLTLIVDAGEVYKPHENVATVLFCSNVYETAYEEPCPPSRTVKELKSDLKITTCAQHAPRAHPIRYVLRPPDRDLHGGRIVHRRAPAEGAAQGAPQGGHCAGQAEDDAPRDDEVARLQQRKVIVLVSQ